MGYLHIENLYRPKAQRILQFREVYALEKVHGTSAHVRWDGERIHLFSGGESAEKFAAVFGTLAPPCSEIHAKAHEIFGAKPVTVYGEAYGGKCQGMSHAYGKSLRFVAFDVRVGETWLSVPDAFDVATKFGIEFVRFALVPATVEALDAERDRLSTQAERHGTYGHNAEGIVIRPPFECVTSDGERLIAKHKRPEFSERATQPPVDPAKLAVLTEAAAVANEWVTDMRLTHVLDHLGNPAEFSDTGRVIKAMVEDVEREASGEIVSSPEVRRAIGSKTAEMYKARLRQIGTK